MSSYAQTRIQNYTHAYIIHYHTKLVMQAHTLRLLSGTAGAGINRLVVTDIGVCALCAHFPYKYCS